MFSAYEMVANKHRYKRQGVLFAIDPLINLTTVNYLLHGLQRYGWDKREQHWHTLWVALGIAEYEPGWAVELSTSQRKELVTYLVQNVIKPFGVPRGSERQGGQHQGLNSPVTWPVDLVTSLVIDGRVINMANLWKAAEINAGDDLMLHIVNQPCEEYVLSRHPGSASTQRFPRLDSEHIYQLVPAVSSSSDAEVQRAIWKEGYWHIARSQVMRYQHERSSVTSGNLLQVTFEPVWMDGREVAAELPAPFDGREVAVELPAPLPPFHAGRRRAGIRALTMIVESLERLADDFPRVCAHDDAAVHAARAVNIAGIIDGLAHVQKELQ
jgi:hypothetical protein